MIAINYDELLNTMIDFAHNIIVIITATGTLISLLLVLLGVKPKCPGLIMT